MLRYSVSASENSFTELNEFDFDYLGACVKFLQMPPDNLLLTFLPIVYLAHVANEQSQVLKWILEFWIRTDEDFMA